MPDASGGDGYAGEEAPEVDIDPATAGPLTMSELVGYAEAHGPAITVARRRAKRGDAEVEGAEMLNPYNPKLRVALGGRTIGDRTFLEIEGEVEQRFWIAGQRGARVEAAEASRDAKRASVDVVRWEQRALIHALYCKVLVRGAQLEAASKLSTFINGVQTVIDKRVEAGEESPLDAMVARAEIARGRQIFIAAKQARATTRLRLAEVIGWPAGVKLEVAGALPAPEPAPPLQKLITHAVDKHPSRKWLELEVRAASARVEQEDLEAWPDPTIGIGYGREAQVGGPANHVWTGAVTVPIPIWARNQGARAAARAEVGVSKGKRAAFVRTVGSRLGAAHAKVDAAAERIEIYGENILPAFEQNLSKLQRAFELGEIDILQLAQIQQRILSVQRQSLRALEDYFDALAALEALSGMELHQGEGP
jgi:cobalt-zinc-cadmium efflux system outer membrane protein